MKARTELILYQCLWMADLLMRPTWRNMTGSFEEWSYRNGFLRQIQTLEEQGCIESMEGHDRMKRVHRLTSKGLLLALGGSLPPERWDRGWDGKWRMAVFDLPEDRRALRNELRRQLRKARFGGLQGSVWVSPDPLGAIRDQLKKTAAECGVLTFFEGATCGGESAEEVVESAWDFAAIKNIYSKYLAHLEALPISGTRAIRENLLAWGQTEKALWAACLASDPLLPRELWPKAYSGARAWQRRITQLGKAGRLAWQEFADK